MTFFSYEITESKESPNEKKQLLEELKFELKKIFGNKRLMYVHVITLANIKNLSGDEYVELINLCNKKIRMGDIFLE